jgi:glycosyltransferase involved in cell wall biosynthesis
MQVVHYNLTTTTKEGGVETFVWDLAREQALRGHDVRIVSGEGPVRRDIAGVTVVTAPFVPRERFAIGPLRRAWAIRKLLERLSMLPRGLKLLEGAGLVHIHKPYDLPLGPFLARRGVPLVYHGHGEGFFPGDTWLCRYADVLLSCSTYNAASLRGRYGREPVVVFNGVDVERFSPGVRDLDLRARLASGSKWLVLLPGRFMPWKGQAHAVRALAEVRDLSVRLALVGDGETREALEALAAEAGVLDRVLFLGTVPHSEMPRYLASADLVLGTSEASETFGMALAEAMSCERPVLASSWVGFDDVVREGETGGRFPSAQPLALAAELRRMLTNPDLLARYGAAGRRHVLTHFTWAQVEGRVQASYARVLEQRAARPKRDPGPPVRS